MQIDTQKNSREKIIDIVRECDWEGLPFPTRRSLATALGVSADRISQIINHLLDAGVIWRANKNVYRLTEFDNACTPKT